METAHPSARNAWFGFSVFCFPLCSFEPSTSSALSLSRSVYLLSRSPLLSVYLSLFLAWSVVSTGLSVPNTLTLCCSGSSFAFNLQAGFLTLRIGKMQTRISMESQQTNLRHACHNMSLGAAKGHVSQERSEQKSCRQRVCGSNWWYTPTVFFCSGAGRKDLTLSMWCCLLCRVCWTA